MVANVTGQKRMDRTDVPLDQSVLNTAALAFYRRHFSGLITALIVTLLLLAGSVTWILLKESREVDREYFGMDFATGRMVRLVPLGQPYLNDAALVARIQACVVNANTYDFVNYRKAFSEAAPCFTNTGWAGFSQALTTSGTLDLVKKNRLVTTASADGTAVIVGKQDVNGVLMWTIQVPLRVTYQSGLGGRVLAPQRLLVTVLVSRVPETDSEWGHGIDNYRAKEA